MEENNKVKEHLEEVIKKTFDCISTVYQKHREGYKINSSDDSFLIFPMRRKKNEDDPISTRVSEQELRFLFIEKFNELNKKNNWGLFYSVETPTKKAYKFGESMSECEEGKSGNFDLVIHNHDTERVALIEFKANNQAPEHFKKDILKLDNENEKSNRTNTLSFFIFLIDGDDEGTYSNLKKKMDGFNGNFYAFSLTNGDIGKKIKPNK